MSYSTIDCARLFASQWANFSEQPPTNLTYTCHCRFLSFSFLKCAVAEILDLIGPPTGHHKIPNHYQLFPLPEAALILKSNHLYCLPQQFANSYFLSPYGNLDLDTDSLFKVGKKSTVMGVNLLSLHPWAFVHVCQSLCLTQPSLLPVCLCFGCHRMFLCGE